MLTLKNIPMTLDELYTALVNANTSGKLNLVPGIFESGPIFEFYQKLTVGSGFTINGATIEKSEDGTTVSVKDGTTSIIGIVDLPVVVDFTEPDDYIVSALNGTLINGSWDIANIDWFSIGDPFVEINVSNSATAITGGIGGTVAIGTPLVLKMDLPAELNQWVLSASFQDNYPSIAYFYQLIGGVNIANVLPSPLNVFSDLGVSNLDLIYDSEQKSLSSIGVVLKTGQSWNLFSNVTLNNLAISLGVSNPGTDDKDTEVAVDGYFNIGDKDPVSGLFPNTIKVSALYPPFVMTASLEEGTIQLGDLVKTFLPSVTIDLKSEIEAFNMQINPTGQEYMLSCEVASDWTFLQLSSPAIAFTMTGMNLQVASQQGKASGKFIGLFNIGADSANDKPGVDITLFAGYDDGTWTFGGNTGTDQIISLIDIAYTFLAPFGIGQIPSWVSNGGVVLDISNVSFLATIPDASKNLPNTYKVGGTVDWQLNFSSFNFGLEAVVAITFTSGEPSKTAGTITATQQLFGLSFDIGYTFGEDTTQISLEWEGIKAVYTNDAVKKQDIITIDVTGMSLGDIITKFMDSFISGFTLPSPWSVLNSINLDGLSFTYTRNLENSAEDTIVIQYKNAVDLGFLNISAILLTKDIEGVHLGFEGTFLGLTISTDDPNTKALAGKGSKVQEMPGVSGLGSDAFDLKFLGLGQHIELANSSGFTSVDDAIDKMKGAFSDTNNQPNTIPIKANSGDLVFNQNSDWLIGADFTVAQFYRMAFIFNDPNLYGLVIGVSDKAQFLKNLQFEILYKKVNDSIGVYQIQLQLPDVFRHLEFGAVSITLPNLGLRIYTNGNFYIDLGWPASVSDFSRSFTLQVFPFIGSGGFYFASLTGATATDLPVAGKGVFNPVIEAGVALSVGVGKTIEAGILKAGLSLTAIGIFQGTYALFTANAPYAGQTDTYYKFSGTLALVGRIYGEINFAIISASLDITAYIQLSFIIEAYKAIPIVFQAGVSVRLTVKINLGLFKISIGLSFSATITASFIIGTDTTNQSLWYKVNNNGLAMRNTFYLNATVPTVLKWQPIIIDTDETFGLDLYFIPHLTVSGETLTSSGQNYSAGPQYVGMLYIDTGTTNPGNYTQFGMTALATGALYWAANAIVGSTTTGGTKLSWLKDQEITLDQIQFLLCYIQKQPNNAAPFNYKNTSGNDIESFLKSFFTVQIAAVDATKDVDMAASVFPVFPDLQMQTVLNETNGALIDFSTQSMTGSQGYLGDVSNLLKTLGVAYESATTASHYATTACEDVTDPDYESQMDLSMPTFIFTDFVALAVKQLLQNATDYFKAQNVTTMKVSDLVLGVITADSIQQLGGMASRFMLHGLRLPQPPLASAGQITPLYVLTGQQWTVPQEIKTTDVYSVNLLNTNASWITFENPTAGVLQVNIDSDSIQRIINLQTNVLDPSVVAGYPKALENINYTPQSFSLGGNALWNYPGDFFAGVATKPTVWKTPSNFRTILEENISPSLNFSLNTLTPDGDSTTKGSISNTKWATVVNVSIQKNTPQDLVEVPLSANIYNLIGADDANISLLEAILVYMNNNQSGSDGFIEQIQFLMKPDPITGQSGLVSSANGDLNAAIIQANLSTDTNPEIAAFKMRSALADPVYNTLNKPGNFVTLLWECSTVRSGGFYFYYITPADGKGLPDSLFGESGVGSLQLVITYGSFVPQPFINAVITGDDLDFSKTTVYAQSADVTVAVPSLMPGNVGYELSRNNPGDFNPSQNPPTEAEDQVYLQNQFNLLGVSLPEVGLYKNYMPAGPVDPVSQDDLQAQKEGKLKVVDDSITPWNYSSTIPYYKFAQGVNDDPNYLNPYAGIGTNVQMTLNWQDMFGNVPAVGVDTLSVAMQLLYTDNILSVSQWPSLSHFYVFGESENSVPELKISFSFDVNRYNDGSAGAMNNAATDLETYMKLMYQLASGDMEISFSSTIQGTQAAPEGLQQIISVTDLSAKFIIPIVTYLKAILNAPNPSVIPITYDVSAVVDLNSIADYADSIPLYVNITMQRIKNVDPDFEHSPGVATAVTAVSPITQGSDSEQSVLSLSGFATQFETTFADKPTAGIVIKIAAAADPDNDASGKALWMVRFDSTGNNGIKYTYDNSKVYFFAPVPLATSLVSLDASINPYTTGMAYPSGGAVVKKYSSVDLDDWGKQFLEAVDSFLSPGLAVPAFLLDNGVTLRNILDQKEALANAIEATIHYIIDSADKSGANIGNAQEKWKQEILKELSATYKYSAAIQTPVTINSKWDESNSDPVDGTLATPKLYGNMVGLDPTVPDDGKAMQASTEYSLSTSKLPMGVGSSWLTYMFESKDTAEFRNFKFGDMQFQVSHLEQGIHTIDGIKGYTASEWLTFILPLSADLSTIGEITIPVPLRAYPTPPSITAQTVKYPTKNEIVTLQDARAWDFIYSYKNAIAAQDTIETQVEFNIPGKDQNALFRGSVAITLDQALAQFIDVYPQINADFKMYLAKLTQKDVIDQSATYTNAKCAVDAFNTILEQVAMAWGSWNQINPRTNNNLGRRAALDTANATGVILKFTVIETGALDTGNLNVQVIADAANTLDYIPSIEIPDYPTKKLVADNTYEYLDTEGNFLSYQNRNIEPLRNVVIEDLDILNTQNAWGGVMITRNLDLLPDGNGGWQPTSPQFLYQTPLVKFYTKLIALLSNQTGIDIATIGTKDYPVGNRSITNNMLALFESFTDGVAADTLNMKLVVNYTYNIPGTSLPITIPVLLIAPFDLSTADKGSSFAGTLANQLTSWLSANIPEDPNGTFNFEIDVFSSLDANALLFQLPLYLAIG